MRGTPHFVESPEPIAAGRDYLALCGKIVPNAYFCFTWDAEMMGQPGFGFSRICQKCLGATVLRDKSTATLRYIYGAVPGDEVTRLERTPDAD